MASALARRLAAQFYSAFSDAGARQRRHSDCICFYLQPLFRNIEQDFVFVWIDLRAGSLADCLGAVRDDRSLEPPCLRAVYVLFFRLSKRSVVVVDVCVGVVLCA